MIPMEVGNKNMRRNSLFRKFLSQLSPERTESCSAIENVNTVTDAHFHARSVAAIA